MGNSVSAHFSFGTLLTPLSWLPGYSSSKAPMNPYVEAYDEIEVFGKDFRRPRGNPYRNLTNDKLRLIGERYGITDLDQFKYSDVDLSNVVDRCYHLEHPYLAISVKSLHKLARLRGLKPPKSARKADLVALLEQADDALTFPFMDLPPELRTRVYRFLFLQVHAFRQDADSTYLYVYPTYGECYHRIDYSGECGAYGTGDGPLMEHPITNVSRQLRQESLPFFYQIRRFPLMELEYDRGLAPGTIELSERKDFTQPWLSSTESRLSLDKLANMRAFYVVVVVDLEHYNLHIDFCRKPSTYTLSWWSTLHMKKRDKPAILEGDDTMREFEIALEEQLQEICTRPGVGHLVHEDLTKLLKALEA
ncbi:hypothetical protein BDV97DRAFT_127495 [Delphinella strobiligena]|nr:hypothetical protein BDV97DRAFT_127495 [Delphinella strobiligena]